MTNENPRGLPVAWCALTQSGKIAYFDGKPMIMVGQVGNEHHTTPLVLATDYAALLAERGAAIARAEAAEALLREVVEWISGWEPSFADDPEWQPVADRIDAAISAMEGRDRG